MGFTPWLIVVVTILLLLTDCEHTTPPIKEVPYCPPPVLNWAGEWKAPSPYHAYQRTSYDGKNLIFRSYGKAYLLNLKTNVVEYIDLQSKLPDNVKLTSAGYFYWCPYDNNRVLIHAVTSTDLPDDSIKRYYYGQNLYIVSLDGSEFKRVTPSIYGLIGAPGFYIYSWLPESKPGYDLIQMTADVPGINTIAKLYIPQTDEFISSENDKLRAISKNGNYYFFEIGRNADAKTVCGINGNEFVFNEEMGLDYCSFSPSGKYLALTVSPQSASWADRRFNEIWIINVEKFLVEKPDTLAPDKIINLRHDFCMYAMVASPCAEFISETVLAVAMYKDGDDKAYLWKVGIDGKLLGQLTFEP
ncbi:hypothetical protein D9V86_12190 [Bacteroidetes/Chlorobi group bacterium ChocPot_Mid]|nr:MAG: hypothetical protein D9V86_12190 [Bacteroidetes/Chlorobi group bacterium ChocPot_Mid]